MTLTDATAPAQSEALSFAFDLHHPPEKVWRALTDPALLAGETIAADAPNRPGR